MRCAWSATSASSRRCQGGRRRERYGPRGHRVPGQVHVSDSYDAPPCEPDVELAVVVAHIAGVRGAAVDTSSVASVRAWSEGNTVGVARGDEPWDSEVVFLQRLAEVDGRARSAGTRLSYGVALVNLVGLRHLNRDVGREVGDRVLDELARRLHATVADAVTVGRVGPSELAVLVDRLPADGVTQLARRIRAGCGGDVDLGDRCVAIELQVTPRAGPSPTHANALWAARSDARWERLVPLVQRLEHLEATAGVSVRGTQAEIRDLRRRLSDAEERADHDGLTGVLNRVGTERALNALPVPFAVAFVDLDDLRGFNATADNYDAGDQALCTVARLLGDVDPEGQVGRWGGDEFVVAVPNLDEHELTRRLRALLDDHHHRRLIAGRPVTFSAGVAAVEHGQDRVMARQRAQQRLRFIKENNLRPAVVDELPHGNGPSDHDDTSSG
ncbi:MAG: diguanylate cyclase [Acidimicrobiales bacterium]